MTVIVDRLDSVIEKAAPAASQVFRSLSRTSAGLALSLQRFLDLLGLLHDFEELTLDAFGFGYELRGRCTLRCNILTADRFPEGLDSRLLLSSLGSGAEL